MSAERVSEPSLSNPISFKSLLTDDVVGIVRTLAPGISSARVATRRVMMRTDVQIQTARNAIRKGTKDGSVNTAGDAIS